MGLDVSHGCWTGAYSAFDRFRAALAFAAGYEGWPRMLFYIADEEDAEDVIEGKWTNTPADPLLVLLVHSDCDGIIQPEQAAPLADRLEELLPKLSEENSFGHLASGTKPACERFIAGLRYAVAQSETITFD